MTQANNFSQEINDLVAKMGPRMTLDKSTGEATIAKDTYASLLPEGITIEVVEQIQDYTKNLATASLYALGTAAIPVWKDNKDLNTASMSMPMSGKDSLNINLTRHSTIPGKDANGNETTRDVYCSSSVKIDTYGIGKRGDMKRVKDFLAESALAALGK
jgi:hypothetical protein